MTEAVRAPLTLADLRAKRAKILSLAAKYGASHVRVFGSVARGDAGAASDVDFLVTFQPGYRLLDLIGLKQDLEDLLGCKVDVAVERTLRDEFRPTIMQDVVAL